RLCPATQRHPPYSSRPFRASVASCSPTGTRIVIRTATRTPQQHGVATVNLGEQHLHVLAGRGRRVLTHVVGPTGQLTVPPVDQGGELHGPGATVVAQRVECRSDRASGEEYIVDQDHCGGIVPAARQGRLREWFRGPTPQIVAM